jgi:hypothetical protein
MKTARTAKSRNTQPRHTSYGGYVPGMACILKGALSLPVMEKFRNSQSQPNILGKLQRPVGSLFL